MAPAAKMTVSRKYDVLIAGAGPAGMATALYLLRQRPALAGRIAALEKGRHPRFKPCAGGLIPKTRAALDELGLELDPPGVEVFGGVARGPGRPIDLGRHTTPLCTVVRRNEFDAGLARAAQAAGLELFEETRILGVAEGDDGVRVATDRGSFETAILVGADGSGSRVRRDLFDRGKANVGRALMVEVAIDPQTAPEFARRLYRFDFQCVAAGIHGYSWSFPCMIDGRPHLNVGIYDQHPRAAAAPGRHKPALLDALRVAFPEVVPARDGGVHTFKAFPIRWYDPADRYASARVLLAGDAAGVDPLMGEGISYAFEHGKLAAGAIARWLDGERAALTQYDRDLRDAAAGRKLRHLAGAARRFYGPRHRLYFTLAGLSGTARLIAVDWYNGTHGVDELSAAGLLRRWAGAVLFRTGLR
jgi:flavin-dependent dehydrogenase